MSEKIGILTFHKALNHGAALQAYVLSDHLRRRGYDAEIIDFLPEGHLKTTEMFVKTVNRGTLKHNLRTLVYLSLLRKREKSFLAFTEMYLKRSDGRNIRYQDLAEAVSRYDAVICGSDQIWNPRLSDTDMGYFLPFELTCRKIAYGISLGNGYLSEYTDPLTVRKAIQSFDHLSFREAEAAGKLQAFIGAETIADIVCDPTLLEDRNFWLQTAAEKQVRGSYVFTYTANGDRAVYTAGRDLADAQHLPYYTMLAGKQSAYWKGMKSHLPPGEQGPSEFLAMIRDAEYVVTNSFHGAVFAILFGRRFCIIAGADKDGNTIRDERLLELLKHFHLEDHYVSAEDAMRAAAMPAPDAETIETIRQAYAESSDAYLQKALCAETEAKRHDSEIPAEVIPKVSIITPCFNAESYLDRYFQCLLDQTYRNLELYFINDGSTDKTADKVRYWQTKLEAHGIPVHYIFQENAGQAAAINQALPVFQGEYVMWPDSDDWFSDDYIEKLVGYLEEHPKAGIVQGRVAYVYAEDPEQTPHVKSYRTHDPHKFRDFILENDVWFGGFMARAVYMREMLPGRKIYETRAGQNWQLLLPVLYKYEFGYVTDTYYYYYIHQDSHSNREKDYRPSCRRHITMRIWSGMRSPSSVCLQKNETVYLKRSGYIICRNEQRLPVSMIRKKIYADITQS
ncbi:MAG: glycosyltransferase [Solobacterium sp.]|nr:glycosyltransferase [Solobacterium sp.]